MVSYRPSIIVPVHLESYLTSVCVCACARACMRPNNNHTGATVFSYVGGEDLEVFLKNVSCNGTESKLIDCSHRGIGVLECAHSHLAGVRCTGAKKVL